MASSLTATMRDEKRPAPATFFETTTKQIEALEQPSLRSLSFNTQKQLAEYRSALEPERKIGTTLICTPDFEGESLTAGRKLMSNVTLMFCPQVLDGIAWRNVAFVNSKIIYKGGPLILDNVVFVNCVFDVERDDRGLQLLNYAALTRSELKIQPESLPVQDRSGI